MGAVRLGRQKHAQINGIWAKSPTALATIRTQLFKDLFVRYFTPLLEKRREFDYVYNLCPNRSTALAGG
jgi:hypothetical protein